jgi:DNA repair protein RadC
VKTGAESELAGAHRASADALRVRAEAEGPDALGTRGLLEIVAGERAVSPALELLSREDLAPLSRRSPQELRARAGLSRAAALRLAAAFALGRRVENSVASPRVPLSGAALVHAVMAPVLRGLDREQFHALLLDTKHRLLRHVRVSEGTLSTALVHPREVFAPALREASAALVVVHNHPSGDPEPSAQDLEVTLRLVQVGNLVGVPLLDHVVIADERYVSLRERLRWDVTASETAAAGRG